MDVVEPAIAENHHHIFFFQEGCDPIDDCVRVLFIERRTSICRNFLHQLLRLQALSFWNLIESCHLRNENTVCLLQSLGQLALKDGAAGCIRSRLKNGPEPVALKPMTQGFERQGYRGRMMTEIVDYFHATRFAANFLPARDAAKCF